MSNEQEAQDGVSWTKTANGEWREWKEGDGEPQYVGKCPPAPWSHGSVVGEVPR